MIVTVGLIAGLLLSVIVTVPACLIVGIPLIYAFRRQLSRAPWRWSLPVTALGMIIGALLFGWTAVSAASPVGIRVVLLFSGTSALSFALLYGLTARSGRGSSRDPNTG